MLWQHYVFRRGAEAQDMWDQLYHARTSEQPPIHLLYIAGRGFDVRAQMVMEKFVESVCAAGKFVASAKLLLVGFTDYELSPELVQQTEQNAAALTNTFKKLGVASSISIGSSIAGEDDISSSTALRIGTDKVLENITTETDIILDVSSLPRVVYLALLTGILNKLIPNKKVQNPLYANGVNFQILVAEDALLDGRIRSEDPSNDLILIPGFWSTLNAESNSDWPMVWFPILGENRVSQLQKVMDSVIPTYAEICPVLPHPSRNSRRADELLAEYEVPLFRSRETPFTNIFYVNEAHPFEAYRQLLGAMERYRLSMQIIGGCRLVVTPLASKLITLGAGLACFEMRPEGMEEGYGVAIPYAEPTRYVASVDDLQASKPEVSALLLTGEAYRIP